MIANQLEVNQQEIEIDDEDNEPIAEDDAEPAIELKKERKPAVLPKWHAFVVDVDGDTISNRIITADTKIALKRALVASKHVDLTGIVRGHLKPLITKVTF
jgi:hypothetical protein